MTDADKVSIIRPTYILSNETPLFAPLSPPWTRRWIPRSLSGDSQNTLYHPSPSVSFISFHPYMNFPPKRYDYIGTNVRTTDRKQKPTSV